MTIATTSAATATATSNQTEITLKGSVDIVSDFFFTAINSILYQRGTCSYCTLVACYSRALLPFCSSVVSLLTLLE